MWLMDRCLDRARNPLSGSKHAIGVDSGLVVT